MQNGRVRDADRDGHEDKEGDGDTDQHGTEELEDDDAA